MEKVTVLDRDGRPYLMRPDEAEAAVATGAYRLETEAPVVSMVHVTPVSGNILHVKEKATGKVFKMHAIDAKEAVKTGFFEYVSVKEETPKQPVKMTASAPLKEPAPAEEKKGLPELSSDMTKKQITQVLREYNISYRKDMTEEQLLALWEEFRNQQ